MDRKIRVLHIGVGDNPGGIENVAISWTRQLPENFEFDFTNNTNTRLAYEDEMIKKGCHVYKIADRYKDPIKHLNDLKQIIKNGNYDYIHHHVMTLIEPEPVILANHAKKTQAIIHCHSNYDKYPFGEAVLEKATRVLLFGRKYLKLSCSREGGLNMFKKDNFTIIENGIDVNKYKFSQTKREEIRKKYNISDDTYVVGHVGRQSPDKNYEFIISSFAKLLETRNNAVLMLVGDIDCDSNEVWELIDKYSVKDKTICTLVVDNPQDYYSAMDVFMFPSVNEGLGIVLIEAQASGLYCVTSTSISRDTKVTDNIEYIELKEDIAVNSLIKGLDSNIKRKDVIIDQRYDINNSSNKIFEYYKNNLK